MLNKIIIFLCLICSNLPFNFIKANELNIFPEADKRYNLSICAIFKNEAKYLKEWIEYHRDFGVDHFYLYNIESRDFFQNILRPYIKDGIVTLINWPEISSDHEGNDAYKWALNTQIPAYENAVNFLARDETKWLVFIDIDEFLVSSEGNIKDLLKKYHNFPAISFSSDFSSQTINKSVAKMIFKPDLCIGFNWPPYHCRFKHNLSSIEADKQELRINSYRKSNRKDSSFRKKKLNEADYCILSEAEADELFEKGYAANGKDNSIFQEVPELLEKGYILENKDLPIYQDVPEFLKRMEYKARTEGLNES